MADNTQQFVTQLLQAGLKGEACDEFTIGDAERRLGVVFPAVYRAFLAIAGKGCPQLEGSHYAIDDDLSEIQRTGQRIANQQNIRLPLDSFVFLTHQGFACQFFLLNDGDDPSVYECVSGIASIQRVAPTYSQWLIDLMRKR